MRMVLAVMLVLGLSLSAARADERGGPAGSPGQTVPAGPGDAEITRLLTVSTADREERLAYVRECERVVAEFPKATLKAEMCRRIGDVYFSLGDPAEMEKWYRKTLAIEPSLRKSTSIGFRLEECGKVRFRRNAAAGALLGAGGLVCLLLTQGVRRRRLFDGRFFLRKLALFTLFYGAMSWIVLAVDARSASRWLLGLTPIEAGNLSIIQPIIPLGMVDTSHLALAGRILLSMFLPLLMAVFATSFRKQPSRWYASGMVLLTVVLLWMHLYYAEASGPIQDRTAFLRNCRLYLQGEPEELLVKDLPKALRANPDLLKSDNDDLKEFVEQHFPEGVKDTKK